MSALKFMTCCIYRKSLHVSNIIKTTLRTMPTVCKANDMGVRIYDEDDINTHTHENVMF